ncbi:transcriptional regulator [Liquorilactobacillus sucicola DSM 21376 = JCM 15457]|uniref:GntR family transcriptional regulator n=1 Tax=Liquorilactobacillus sucicola DSM 21376 = JCM 15457 TaxID=1423806 RepID=A0A023CW29_9LACO|nr:PLP-dependent aminotransferase family protein [Liquorilactobacillus sucicola]KRN05694.1 GntR family transcriptional regulator [Liquorilactobacillus sucicola DSM 21376 = JCM 15457]GAJ25781.1 transcriptional regulator [Liquorilactobacillus sucicola DSM 21376 = JCM 15457]
MPINIFEQNSLTWMPKREELKRPIYKALVDKMKSDVKKGTLLPGTRLPSQRELADFLDINFTTVTRSYKLSESLGLTYGVVGKGTYIAQTANKSGVISSPHEESLFELGLNSSFEQCSRFLNTTIADVAVQNGLENLLDYKNATGTTFQRQVAVNYLAKLGVKTSIDNIAVTSGGQNALTIILLGLFNSNDKIAVDHFTYANLIELAKMINIKLIPIDFDADGMLPENLERACRSNELRGVYLMPNYSNPTGIRMSEKRRRMLAEVIAKNALIVIEDDYLGFIDMEKEHIPVKLSTLLPEQSIYICSMSKSIAAGLRVGYLVFPKVYQQDLLQALCSINIKTSSLDAEIITQALLSGTAYTIMHKKIQLGLKANEIFYKVFPQKCEVRKNVPTFIKWVPLKNNELGAESIEKLLLANGIRVFHSDRFLVGPKIGKEFLRISLSATQNIELLEKALIKLKRVLSDNDLI